MLCNVLYVLKTIMQYQQVVVCNLNMDYINTGSDNTRILLDLLKDKRNSDRIKSITDNNGKMKLLLDIIKRKVYDDGDPATESTTDVLISALEERCGNTEDMNTTSAIILDILNNSTDAISRQILDSIKISMSISSLCMIKCELQSCVFIYVLSQLINCTKLTRLDLSGTFGLRQETGDIIAKMMSLKELCLYNCCMAQTVSDAMMVGVLNCNNLESLDLGENSMTDCIAFLLSRTTRFPKLKTLLLSDAELSKDDILSISAAIKDDKLPHLQILHLSRNDLTESLKSFFGTGSHPGFQLLEEFHIDNAQTSNSDIWAISNAILQDKLPNMSQFTYSPDILSQLLTCFLSDVGVQHPGLQFVECLTLSRIKFSPSSLSSAFRLGNFPRVKEMDFSFSHFHDCFGALFANNSCTFPLLESLNLTNTGLSVVGLSHFQTAIQRNTFISLRKLFMSHNVLKNRIGQIFTDLGFPVLEVLELCNTRLDKADVISLSVAVHSGKLPSLKVLNLAENVLTDTLSFLLDDSSGTAGFQSLESLSLGYTDLCKTDMEFLSGANSTGRLPNLGSLDLEGNSLSSKQDETENLILLCAFQYKERDLKISLKDNDFSTQFSSDLVSMCQETKVTLKL